MHIYIHTALLTTVVAIAALTASSATAQENASTASKLYSVGPAIEFSGSGTSFGIKGRISNPGTPVSVRPLILFGYTPTVSGATFNQAILNGGNLNGFAALTPEQKRAQVKLFTDVPLTEQQADEVANQLSTALTTAPARRTPEQDFYIVKALTSPTRRRLVLHQVRAQLMARLSLMILSLRTKSSLAI